MKKLRIAVDGRPALWNTMGIGSVAYNFIKHIQTVDTHNDYTFYFDDDPIKLKELLPNHNYEFTAIKNRLIWTNFYMSSQLYKGNYDLFITFLDRDIPLVTFNAKHITLICDLIPLIYSPSFFRSPFHKLYYKIFMFYSIVRSDKILTISECSKHDIIKHYSIDDKKVSIITLGASDTVKNNNIDVLNKYHIKNKYILAFGSTEPRKNNVHLIKAFNSIKDSITDIYLVIVGKEWRGLRFDNELLHDKIILTGYVPDEDMPYLYKNAELVVFPSLYEGFGLPVLEAMTYGIPVVTSNTSSLPEVGGDAVEYVNPKDVSEIARTIKKVLCDDKNRETKAENGMRRAKQFNWQIMCEQIVSACKEVVH